MSPIVSQFAEDTLEETVEVFYECDVALKRDQSLDVLEEDLLEQRRGSVHVVYETSPHHFCRLALTQLTSKQLLGYRGEYFSDFFLPLVLRIKRQIYLVVYFGQALHFAPPSAIHSALVAFFIIRGEADVWPFVSPHRRVNYCCGAGGWRDE